MMDVEMAGYASVQEYIDVVLDDEAPSAERERNIIYSHR